MASAENASVKSVLVMRVGEVLCAVGLEYVLEIMRPLALQPVQKAPDYVLGLALVRGQGLPVVDLGRLLGLDFRGEHGRWVALRCGDRRVALAVESVPGIRRFESGMLQGLPPLLSRGGPQSVRELGALDERLLLVLEQSRLLPEEALKALAEEDKGHG